MKGILHLRCCRLFYHSELIHMFNEGWTPGNTGQGNTFRVVDFPDSTFNRLAPFFAFWSEEYHIGTGQMGPIGTTHGVPTGLGATSRTSHRPRVDNESVGGTENDRRHVTLGCFELWPFVNRYVSLTFVCRFKNAYPRYGQNRPHAGIHINMQAYKATRSVWSVSQFDLSHAYSSFSTLPRAPTISSGSVVRPPWHPPLSHLRNGDRPGAPNESLRDSIEPC